MKAVLCKLRFNALAKIDPHQELEEWFKSDVATWAQSKVPREKIEIIKELLYFPDGLELLVIADLEPEDYIYWNLRWA